MSTYRRRRDRGAASGRSPLPLPGQARDHARRQVRRVSSEQRDQRLPELAGGNAAQVKHRQQGIEALRTPRPARQDVRGETDLLLAGTRPRGRAPSGAARRARRSRSGCSAPARCHAGRPVGGHRAGLLPQTARRSSASALSAAASIWRAPSRAISVSGSSIDPGW